MSEIAKSTQPLLFIAPPFARRAQTLLWVVYVLLPIFTGILAFDWLPNEYYDARRHELLASHEVCDDWGRCGDKNDAWMDKKTGKVFTPSDFQKHRKSEAIRMASVDIFYALVGCFMFASRLSG